VNGEVVLNRSLVHGADAAGTEDEELNAIGNSAAEENGLSESRPLSCEPSREHELAWAADRGQAEASKSAHQREQHDAENANGASASSNQVGNLMLLFSFITAREACKYK